MLLPVEIVPKPVVIEPLAKAPVPVMLPCTAVGSVCVKLGTPVPSVAKIALAAEFVACTGLVPLPYKIPFVVKVLAPVPPFVTLIEPVLTRPDPSVWSTPEPKPGNVIAPTEEIPIRVVPFVLMFKPYASLVPKSAVAPKLLPP